MRSMTRCVVVAVLLVASAASAQDAAKSANLTGAGAATCVEATLPRGCIYLPVTAAGSVTFRLSGTWSATVLAEGSPDGDAADAWVALDIHTLATGAWTMAASTTAIGTYAVSATGMKTIRLRASAYTSGTAVVDAWVHSDPWSVVYARAADGSLQVSTGVGALSLGKAEDTAHGSGDVGVMSLAVRNDAYAARSGSDGDYTPLAVDSAGRLGLAAGTLNIGNVDVVSFPAAATVDTESSALVADATMEAATSNMRLHGFTARESAAGAAAATVILRHGVVAGTCTGNVIAYIELAPNESVGEIFPNRGLAVASGVCADWVAGTVDVNIDTVIEASP